MTENKNQQFERPTGLYPDVLRSLSELRGLVCGLAITELGPEERLNIARLASETRDALRKLVASEVEAPEPPDEVAPPVAAA